MWNDGIHINISSLVPMRETTNTKGLCLITLSISQAALKEAKQSKGGGDKEIESLKSEVKVIFLAAL